MPRALNVDIAEFEKVMAQCKQRQKQRLAAEMIIDAVKQKRKETIERKNFEPHAVLVGIYSRPTMIAAWVRSVG